MLNKKVSFLRIETDRESGKSEVELGGTPPQILFQSDGVDCSDLRGAQYSRRGICCKPAGSHSEIQSRCAQEEDCRRIQSLQEGVDNEKADNRLP